MFINLPPTCTAVRATPDGSAITAISCSSSTYCQAVTDSGLGVAFDGTAWTASTIEANDHMRNVSCASTMFCAASDYSGRVTYNYGDGWSKPKHVVSDDVQALSCISRTFCMALGYDAKSYVFNGKTWTGAGSTGAFDDDPHVSCSAKTLCVATDSGSTASVYDGGGWKATSVDTHYFIDSFSCRATSCVIADANGYAAEYVDGAWGKLRKADPVTNEGPYVSCGSPDFCVGVDAYGYQVTGTR